MTKKHFKEIASILNKIFNELNLTDTEKLIIYDYFEGYLCSQNKNFDASKFYEAVFDGRD
jgi:uncharacterized protein YjgD (DUF1641 family)